MKFALNSNGTFDYFPAYSQGMQQEWCESRGQPAGCHVPTAAERNAPDVGNSFLSTANGSIAVEFANFSATTVARTVATLCGPYKRDPHHMVISMDDSERLLSNLL